MESLKHPGKGEEMAYQDRSQCGKLSLSETGKEVTLAGWVDALRDHGEVLFIHLRDRSGVVQVVFTPESTPKTICTRAGLLKSEFCILLVGQVVKRAKGTENSGIPTGDIEVVAK
jgi:aspartyl-tRNA synthetase